MALKFCEKPLDLQKLEILLNRIPPNHPKRTQIEKRLIRKNAGYQGEKSLEYYFNFLNQKDYLILHNIRLPYQSHYFQIDFIVMHSKFILILEVKNMSGTLIFERENNQLIQRNDTIEKVYKDPILQVEHQTFQFRKWLLLNNFPIIPTESVVVVANETAKITDKGSIPITGRVIRNTKILEFINELDASYNQDIISTKDLKKLKKKINKDNTPSKPDLMEKYKIKQDELLTGVICPTCSSIPMTRTYGKWVCYICSNSSFNAHISALRDYSFLISPFITNTQFKEYLHLKSLRTAQRMLKSLNLPSSNRAYDLNTLFKNV